MASHISWTFVAFFFTCWTERHKLLSAGCRCKRSYDSEGMTDHWEAEGDACPLYTYSAGVYHRAGLRLCDNGCCGQYPDYFCCSYSTGATAGIVLGGILLTFLLVVLCALCLRKRPKAAGPALLSSSTEGLAGAIVLRDLSSSSSSIGVRYTTTQPPLPQPPPYKPQASPPPAYRGLETGRPYPGDLASHADGPRRPCEAAELEYRQIALCASKGSCDYNQIFPPLASAPPPYSAAVLGTPTVFPFTGVGRDVVLPAEAVAPTSERSYSAVRFSLGRPRSLSCTDRSTTPVSSYCSSSAAVAGRPALVLETRSAEEVAGSSVDGESVGCQSLQVTAQRSLQASAATSTEAATTENRNRFG